MISTILYTLGISTNALIVIASMLLGWVYLNIRQIRNKEKSIEATPKGLRAFEAIPSPPQWPIIGHMHLLREYEQNHWDGLDLIRTIWGDPVRLQMGTLRMVMISDPKLMQEVLVAKGDIFCDRPGFDRLEIVFGDRAHSLALCDYTVEHKDRRKMCTRAIIPMQSSARGALLENMISRHTAKWISDFQAKIDSSKDGITNATKTDVLFLTGDIFLDYLARETRPHSDTEYQWFNYGADYLFWEVQQSYLVDFFPFMKKFGLCYSQLKHLDKVSTRLRNYVADDVWAPRFKAHTERIKRGEKCQFKSGQVDDINFLDAMVLDYYSNAYSLKLGDYKLGFADLYGGHAAVANILMRTLGHLALRPDMQAKVFEEASRVKVDEQNHLPLLPWAQAVVQESLRIASSPIVPHVAKEDSSLGEYFIPKGTTVLFNNYYVNRDERFWERPLEWDPSRFIDPSSGELKLPSYFMPFSVGLRSCLGYKMVNVVTAFACSYICQRFHLSANKPELTEKLLTPKAMLALNPDVECFEIQLKLR